MKALVYTGPGTLDCREEPDPALLPGDSIVRVSAVGVCGSDMHAYLGHDNRRPAPLILGHEAMGVAEGGRLDGKRVVLNPLVTCGYCDACRSGRENICRKRQILSIAPRQGAFAEKLAIPDRNMVTVPDTLADSQAALAEPLATGWHAISAATAASRKPLNDCCALVIGGGAVGMAASLALAAQGCGEIYIAETNPLRRDTVSRAGIGTVFDPSTGNTLGDDTIDVVVDCVGSGHTRSLASLSVAPGGVFVHVGLQDSEPGLDIRKITLQEVTVVGTYTYTMNDFRDTVRAMADGRLGALDWYEERPLSEGARTFEDLRASRSAAVKIILRP